MGSDFATAAPRKEHSVFLVDLYTVDQLPIVIAVEPLAGDHDRIVLVPDIEDSAFQHEAVLADFEVALDADGLELVHCLHGFDGVQLCVVEGVPYCEEVLLVQGVKLQAVRGVKRARKVGNLLAQYVASVETVGVQYFDGL
jgi:hypothetical protein